MNQVSLVQKAQRVQQLLCKDADEGRAETSELVLLDQLVEVDAEQFKGKAEVLAVDEGVLQTEEVVVVVLVVLAVQLWRVKISRMFPIMAFN